MSIWDFVARAVLVNSNSEGDPPLGWALWHFIGLHDAMNFGMRSTKYYLIISPQCLTYLREVVVLEGRSKRRASANVEGN
jgi:hypothetical protein